MDVLVVDNNDSFVYNLVQLLRERAETMIHVVKVEEIDFEQLASFSHLLLSPGPGIPEEQPNLLRLIETCQQTHTILGVCLGMQAIAYTFGCRLTQLPAPKHGHQSSLEIIDNTSLLRNIPHGSIIGRYHSWVVEATALPSSIKVMATDDEGNIMAIRHAEKPLWGVQFHPESYITQHGERYLDNWLTTSPPKQ